MLYKSFRMLEKIDKTKKKSNLEILIKNVFQWHNGKYYNKIVNIHTLLFALDITL